jgi:hypothetical protein
VISIEEGLTVEVDPFFICAIPVPDILTPNSFASPLPLSVGLSDNQFLTNLTEKPQLLLPLDLPRLTS